MPHIKNIIFSTTRQWNPGDELIFTGVLNVFTELIGDRFNPILYNRHPDIRSCRQDEQYFKTARVPQNFHTDDSKRTLEANLKFGFFDNSLKPDTDCSFADWVVFAGSPEWCNGRSHDLYTHILRHNIPVMILGVGGGLDIYRPEFLEVIQKAKALTVRDAATLTAVQPANSNAIRMACPALLSAPRSKERHVGAVQKIGLIFQASVQESVIWNGCSDDAYDYQIGLLNRIIRQHGSQYDLGIICHYIDELPLAKKLFPQHEILYSYNALDYLDIYRQFDLVVGTRVHGIGAAASVGVPGVAIQHCPRGATCHGFLADVVDCETTPLDKAMTIMAGAITSAHEKSADILEHKNKTMDAYKKIVARALSDTKVSYTPYKPLPKKADEAQDLAAIMELATFVQNKCSLEIRTMEKEKQRQLRDLQKHIKALSNSTSWKITAPLRALKRLISGPDND